MGFTDYFKVKEFKNIISEQNAKLEKYQKTFEDLGAERYEQVTEKVNYLESRRISLETAISNLSTQATTLRSELDTLFIQRDELQTKYNSQQKKLSKMKELYKSVDYAIKTYPEITSAGKISLNDEVVLDELVPSVITKLHHMDVKSLSIAFKENDRLIEKVLAQYSTRYTTKTNQTIYKLMVIALRAELQNVLADLKYGAIDKSISDIKKITGKYLSIATEGNQSIAGTITKFIGEIEYLFINAAKIEYNYYVKKEQAKQEQLALRQQIREEAEERKQLELEKKRIIQEETKYQNEIEKTRQQLSITQDSDEIEKLNIKILDLESKLSDVIVQKDKIAQLQNGKAGNVYIISNRGAFGESIFKVGMTRRVDPIERINELGSASVPFRFDVHSLIFSEDAVSLESALHNRLNEKRVNRVNMRKEFFYSTLDELEVFVNELDPTAEFVKTMFAEEYNQSLASSENFDSTISIVDEGDEEETID